MKKLMIILSIVILFQTQDPGVLHNYDDMETIYELSEETGLRLSEWQTVYVETLSVETFNRLLPLLLEHFNLHEDVDDQRHKYSFNSGNDSGSSSLKQEITAVVPAGAQQVKVHIVLYGTDWNKRVKEDYTNMTYQLQKDFNFDLATNFTCAKLNEDGIINDGYLLDAIIGNLQAIHMDEQQDNVADSTYERTVYGNSPLFTEKIEIEHKQINFQAAIRKKENQKKQVILGTPLILNEY